MIALGPPAELSHAGWHVAATGAWMAIWWMTEALPLAGTALLPLVLFPALDVQPLPQTASDYAHPLIFLFLGGFLLARAMHVWELDRRIALAVVRWVGTAPTRTIAALMLVPAFVSMWVSNTATAMVMLPIGGAIVAARSVGPYADDSHFAPALMLGIAYAATIGGMGTLIGTPPNALFAGYMSTTHGVQIGFARWMLVGVPMVLIMLPVAWIVLTRIAFRVSRATAPDSGAAAGIGETRPLDRGARLTAAIMAATALAWIARPMVEDLVPGVTITDAGIAVTAAVLLFAIPAAPSQGRFLLSWSEAVQIRWDVLILFGGGLALAGAIAATDLDAWLGARLTALDALPLVVTLLLLGALVVFAGELASNTAMAAVLLPVAGAAAHSLGLPVVLLTLPVALYATLGFMLPVATPPNAIIFGTGAVSIRQMIRAGLILNLVGIVMVTVIVLTVGRVVFPAG
jgi:sodium-dependent dicarboxylate transporter 2/3/5